LQETAKESGALTLFLKATGFSATEKMNRTIAANAGRSYGTRLFKQLVKNPNNKRARRILEELGVNVDSAIKNKTLSDDDVLMMAKKFTDMTQFRSRPQDLPLFASSPGGKVFFQFKSYIYGQTRLLNKTVVEEMKNLSFGRATRNLLILATVFPLAGEVIADIRSLISGRERESKGLTRYLEDIAQVGAMGILLDTLNAGKYGRGAEFLAGPSVSDAGELIEAVGQITADQPKTDRGMTPKEKTTRALGKFVTRRIPIIGNRVTEAVFPDKKTTTKKKTTRKLTR
jgi:hypothetical protein